jgi:TatD DNase family protein
MFIDSHTHLDAKRFDADRDEVLRRAVAGGVGTMLTIGQADRSVEPLRRVIEFVERSPHLYTSVGLHPHDARHYTDELGLEMRGLASHPKVVGWGECGLDFYYDNSPRETQRAVFCAQLEMARACGLPVIVHSRDAADETVAILEEYLADWPADVPRGVWHCFSYGPDVAARAVELGMLVSFSGIVTFESAVEVRQAAVEVPLYHILIETDAPYLAPVPYRGRRNEPLYVVHTAAAIAGLRGITTDAVAAATKANFGRLFLEM